MRNTQEQRGTLDPLSQVLYYIAVSSNVILSIRIVMTIVDFGQNGPGVGPDDLSGLDGFGNSVDFDVDISGDTGLDSADPGMGSSRSLGDLGALHLFTLEGIVAFLAVLSWTAILACQSGVAGTLSVFIDVVPGVLAMYGVTKIIQLATRLASNGMLRMRNVLGQTATVYLTIPAWEAEQGEVDLMVWECFTEASVITDEAVGLPSGVFVWVVDVHADNVLVMEQEEEEPSDPAQRQKQYENIEIGRSSYGN